MAHQYHKVKPTADNLNGFQEHDPIDFLITAEPGRALKPGSIALEYELIVETTGGTQVSNAVTDEIVMKNASVFFDSMSVEIENKGKVENLLHYPRYCAMINSATKSDRMLFSSEEQLEGVMPYRSQGFLNVQQKATQTETSTVKENPRYVIQPKICLNRSAGGEYKFGEMGYIRLSVTLARAVTALYGRYSATNDVSYTLKNVAVRYETVLEDPNNKMPLMCFSYKSIKSSLDSQENNIQALVNSQNCNGVIMSFVPQNEENLFVNDSQKGAVLKDIDSIRFLYNSNLGERIAYNVEDLDEMLKQATQALKENGTDAVTRRMMGINDNFILGVDFKAMVNLSNVNTQINITLNSTLAGNPHNAYLYFLEVLQL